MKKKDVSKGCTHPSSTIPPLSDEFKKGLLTLVEGAAKKNAEDGGGVWSSLSTSVTWGAVQLIVAYRHTAEGVAEIHKGQDPGSIRRIYDLLMDPTGSQLEQCIDAAFGEPSVVDWLPPSLNIESCTAETLDAFLERAKRIIAHLGEPFCDDEPPTTRFKGMLDTLVPGC